MTVYRTSTIRRARRTKEQVDQLDQQILDVLAEDWPQSVRHVFYRMTDPRLAEPVEKSERGYRHVQDRIVKLRRSGRLPYGWITDATRRGYFTRTYRDGADFIRDMAGAYRADLWRHAEYYAEVWTESRSIAGVVQRDCEELAVSLYPAGGFSSISLAYQAAEDINEEHDGRKVVVFYIGDYDPAGVLIDVALERELRQHLDPAVDFAFIRLGITEEQIEQYGLPTNPRKEKDRRAAHVKAAVEAEAMPAGVLRQILRHRLEVLLPPRALEVARVAEQSERAHLERMADLWGREAGMSTSFAPLPTRAMADARLAGRHYRALAAVAAHDRLGKNGQGCWASYERLCEMTGLESGRLSRAIHELVSFGYLVMSKHPMDRRKRVLRVVYRDDDAAVMDGSRGQNSCQNEQLNSCQDGQRSEGAVVVNSDNEIPEIVVTAERQAFDPKAESGRNILRETYIENISRSEEGNSAEAASEFHSAGGSPEGAPARPPRPPSRTFPRRDPQHELEQEVAGYLSQVFVELTRTSDPRTLCGELGHLRRFAEMDTLSDDARTGAARLIARIEGAPA